MNSAAHCERLADSSGVPVCGPAAFLEHEAPVGPAQNHPHGLGAAAQVPVPVGLKHLNLWGRDHRIHGIEAKTADEPCVDGEGGVQLDSIGRDASLDQALDSIGRDASLDQAL